VRQTTSQPAATRLSPQVLSATKLSDTRSPPWAHKDRLYSPPTQSVRAALALCLTGQVTHERRPTTTYYLCV
jgi:hypothetical protein